MPDTFTTPEALAAHLSTLPFRGKRRLIAIAGPPAAGKSTLAADLVARIDNAVLVPMDGFHLDNRILDARGIRARKGAPETFDAFGFISAVRRLAVEPNVFLPDFDRCVDVAIAGRIEVKPEHRTLVFEGNYLCCTEAPWSELMPLWHYSVFTPAPLDLLHERLVQRWLDHGLSQTDAEMRAAGNDLRNARFVMETRAETDAEYLPA